MRARRGWCDPGSARQLGRRVIRAVHEEVQHGRPGLTRKEPPDRRQFLAADHDLMISEVSWAYGERERR
jgi:hypothetical protein